MLAGGFWNDPGGTVAKSQEQKQIEEKTGQAVSWIRKQNSNPMKVDQAEMLPFPSGQVKRSLPNIGLSTPPTPLSVTLP